MVDSFSKLSMDRLPRERKQLVLQGSLALISIATSMKLVNLLNLFIHWLGLK